MLEKYGKDITLCPKCSRGKLMLIHIDYGGSAIPGNKKQALLTDAKTPTLAHRKNNRASASMKKALIMGQKRWPLKWVMGGMLNGEKEYHQHPLTQCIFQSVGIRNSAPSLLYHL